MSYLWYVDLAELYDSSKVCKRYNCELRVRRVETDLFGPSARDVRRRWWSLNTTPEGYMEPNRCFREGQVCPNAHTGQCVGGKLAVCSASHGTVYART